MIKFGPVHGQNSTLTHFPHYWPSVRRIHDDVTQWKHFPRYWPCLGGIHRSPVNSPHKGQWRGALMFSCASVNAWVNNLGAGDLRRHRDHYDVTVMIQNNPQQISAILLCFVLSWLCCRSLWIYLWYLGPVSLRLMTSQFKDIVTHTQKYKTVKCIFCGVWIQNFVRNFKGVLWNCTQNFEPMQRKICILRGCKKLTTCDIVELWRVKS